MFSFSMNSFLDSAHCTILQNIIKSLLDVFYGALTKNFSNILEDFTGLYKERGYDGV